MLRGFPGSQEGARASGVFCQRHDECCHVVRRRSREMFAAKVSLGALPFLTDDRGLWGNTSGRVRTTISVCSRRAFFLWLGAFSWLQWAEYSGQRQTFCSNGSGMDGACVFGHRLTGQSGAKLQQRLLVGVRA